jgi:hypothetical protein
VTIEGGSATALDSILNHTIISNTATVRSNTSLASMLIAALAQNTAIASLLTTTQSQNTAIASLLGHTIVSNTATVGSNTLLSALRTASESQNTAVASILTHTAVSNTATVGANNLLSIIRVATEASNTLLALIRTASEASNTFLANVRNETLTQTSTLAAIQLASDATAAAAIDASPVTITGNVGYQGTNSRYVRVANNSTNVNVQISSGAVGDFISHLKITPLSMNPGSITLWDNTAPLTIFVGGINSVPSLIGWTDFCNMRSTNGKWKLTVGANLTVIVVGDFS